MEVILPHGEVVSVPLERLTLLNNEGMDDLGMWPEDDVMTVSEGSSYGSDQVMEEVLYPDGVQPQGEEELDGWETEGSEGGDEAMQSAEEDWANQDEEEPDKPLAMPGALPTSPPEPSESTLAATVDVPAEAGPSTNSNANGRSILDELDEENSPWHRFEILPSAPADHAYYGTKSSAAQPPKAFLTRLSKEYKVLASSLPSTSHFFSLTFPVLTLRSHFKIRFWFGRTRTVPIC